ncbi:PREDICTED: BTB/POZ domain-containing protein At2g04740 [Brassica oleracea var. oleracea]|uniref:BTB domain-containing protein n=1 Tax=Brassica oleracea var. oleracea TaxID=109376 RepID=A0A0D3BDD5_BRAOL|nr:PREDICTED: BTB/POZ domain-containing protein At2g04740 [Brassica oleracea var. oleracea]
MSPIENSSSWTLESDLEDLDIDLQDYGPSLPLKKVPNGDIFEASRAGDVDRLRYLLETGVNVNARDRWDSVALYYACLTGRLDAARLLLENGAICSEHTFDGDRCHYASLNLRIRKLLKAFEARPPPLAPLQASLRDTFLGCRHNQAYLKQGSDANSVDETGSSSYFPPDVTFFVQGRPIEAHRVILSARSPFFKQKFENEWKDRREVRFSKEKLSYPALCSLIHFFYSDRLEISVDDMEDLVRICKVCKCESLQKIVEKELIHQRYAEYKTHRDLDNSMKRFILQGVALPEEVRLPASLGRILGVDSLADVCVRVDKRSYYCHQVILASRSEYFRARLSRVNDFNEGKNGLPGDSLPFLEEHDLSAEAFEKMIEYMYTDGLKEISPDQAEEIFDVASRYLLFPLKRAVADALLPHLESATPAELCHWLVLSDMYGVLKIREYCLDLVACNFEAFVETREFRAMLLTLPPPSGDSSLRTTVPSAPGATMTTDQGNLLDDLREKWLEAEALELDMRDESALIFDKRLRVLVEMAEQEKSESEAEDNRHRSMIVVGSLLKRVW